VIRWSALLIAVAGQGSNGGHIFDQTVKRSLCGVEKRLSHNSYELDYFDQELVEWLKDNRPFVCRTCLKRYDRATTT